MYMRYIIRCDYMCCVLDQAGHHAAEDVGGDGLIVIIIVTSITITIKQKQRTHIISNHNKQSWY